MGRLPRACAVLAVSAVPLLSALPAARADASSQVQTTATAVHVTITQQPASSLITASLFDDALAYASSEFDTGGSSEALAAPVFPGRLVVQGPQLLCSQLFSCPAQPPDYPFLADASYPRRAHDTATASGTPMGSGPFVVTPLTASARASDHSNRASTAAGSAQLLAGTAGAVQIGASSATTSMRSSAHGTTATVTTTVSDITIGGMVHIASVHSTDRIDVAPGRAPVARPSITVGGVTVSGHTASIDAHGLRVDGVRGPGLAREVRERGISIRTVGTQHQRTSNGSRSEATGLRIDVALPVSGLPYVPNPLPPLPPPFDQIPALPGVNANGTYVGQITLGAVGAAAGVGLEPSFDLGGTRPASTPAATPSDAFTPGRSAPLGGNDLVGRLSAPSSAGSPPSIATGEPPVLRAFIDLVSKNQVETLYAVLALGTLTLFIGWRAATGVRAGRSR